MRIVIDMQGAQTESRFRGIGRYTLSLARAIVRNRGEHEIILALNGLLLETIEPIRAEFDGLLPQGNIRVWYAPGPIREADCANQRRREVAERLREAFLASLHADVVLITSLFEGFGDDAATSVGILDGHIPVAVILYDLIPLVNPDSHFKSSRLYQDYYSRKIASLRRCHRLLAISESTRQEAIDALGVDEHRIVNISGACDTFFKTLSLTDAERIEVCRKVGITKQFVMYTGGADERKNLHRLIQAYADLPASVRDRHQLALVGKIPDGNVSDLLQAVRKCGLASNEVVITGYVTDDELRTLYNSCALFVFPSLHEGFGIPPLEAMACGAAVIASNATSPSEVVGRTDALFDPRSVASISDKIKQALTDQAFRASLVAHGRSRAALFSWEESAKRALDALQDFDFGLAAQKQAPLRIQKTSVFRRRHKRILLVKLDHMGDFVLAIPALTKLKAKYPYATFDIVVGSWNVPIARTLGIFDNVYTFDFYKRKSAEPASAIEGETDALLEKLGCYDIAIDLRRQRDTRFLLAKTRAKLRVGYETFDPDIDRRLDIAIRSYPDIPFETTPLNKTPIAAQMLRLVDSLPQDINDFVCFPELSGRGHAEPGALAVFPGAGNECKEWGSQNYAELIGLLENDPRVQSINVYFASVDESRRFGLRSGRKRQVHIGLDFHGLVQSLSRNTVCVANNSFGAHIASYLGLSVIGLYAGHETVTEWAPVFGDSYVIHSAVLCSPCHIAKPSDCQKGLMCLSDMSVDVVHRMIVNALLSPRHSPRGGEENPVSESFGRKSVEEVVRELISSIADLGLDKAGLTEDEKKAIAESIAANIQPTDFAQQLLVDVSEFVQRDAKSGIQRVVRAILYELLTRPPQGVRVEPVYATSQEGYRYARRFTESFLGRGEDGLCDEPIEYQSGDVFLGLDLQPQVVVAQRDSYQRMRRHGVQVQFVVYDLLCILMPQHFVEGSEEGHIQWLNVVAESDGAICISKAVANELDAWCKRNGPRRLRPFKISSFQLGADIENPVSSTGAQDGFEALVDILRLQSSFLMVGTLEPRKGHAQTLSAFERLWAEGVNANLVIVGKQGWKVDGLVDRLRQHEGLGKRLWWLEGISDECLERLYSAATCLIVASEGEGFGLPLIEAARHKLPIVSRDLPVFREVAGEHAFYFSGAAPEDLAAAIREWLRLHAKGETPSSDAIYWLTWQESARQLLDVILETRRCVKELSEEGRVSAVTIACSERRV